MTYPLEPFQCVDPEKMRAVMRAYPLATMISFSGADDPWPVITQVPLVLEAERGARGHLLGHFDRNNPHGAVLRRRREVSVMFSGPNHYMSPSIYPTEQYPGWNYFTVHVRALARPLDDRERVRGILFRLAELHEPAASGYRLQTTQANFERFLDGVFGFELEVVEARAILKLAQDKGADHAAIAAAHLAETSKRDILPLLEQLLGRR
jgi:transcriptional regulator